MARGLTMQASPGRTDMPWRGRFVNIWPPSLFSDAENVQETPQSARGGNRPRVP